jgi:mRNA interferase MazF
MPFAAACIYEGVEGQVALDQVRTVDKARPVRRLGRIAEEVQEAVLATLAEMFGP